MYVFEKVFSFHFYYYKTGVIAFAVVVVMILAYIRKRSLEKQGKTNTAGYCCSFLKILDFAKCKISKISKIRLSRDTALRVDVFGAQATQKNLGTYQPVLFHLLNS
jgi:hypothetical protein